MRSQKHSEYQILKKSSGVKVGKWEANNRGIASKILKKYGYEGFGGIGKRLDGISVPITAVKKTRFNQTIETTEISDQNITPSMRSNRVKNNTKPWPKNTTLIIGDSMIGGIEESRLKNYNAKVKSHGGATVDDVYDYITPLLRKVPTNIILHIGTNDAPYKLAKEIYDEIINLMKYIQNELPNVNIHLSCPILRTDHAKANTVLRVLDRKFKDSSMNIIPNDNIDGTCLAKRGLHLNQKGSGNLAMNFIKILKTTCV